MAFPKPPSQNFLDQFLCWIRLEPRCRAESHVQKGLEACTADPLWMLARQWQMGEFQGEDNGSPVDVEIKYTTKLFNKVKFPGNGQVDLSEKTPPLETIVERESLFKDHKKQEPIDLDWRTRVQIGQQFERIIKKDLGDDAKAVIEELRKPEVIGLQPNPDAHKSFDYETQHFLNLMKGRAIDGGQAIQCLRAGKFPDISGLSRTKTKVYQNAYKRLDKWYLQLYSQPANEKERAWHTPHLNYLFTLIGQTDNQAVEFEAPDYRNGDLEWYALDFNKSTSARPQRITGVVQTEYATPTRISYAGKPSERWWTFEDYQVNLAAHNAETTDLSRLLLSEFSLVYADDWFFVPLELPVGCLTEIKTLKVGDVFGDTFNIGPAFDPGETERDRWDLFTHAYRDNYGKTLAGALLIPPSFGDREESTPLEEVNFIRDEMANMVFAIERTVCNGMGQPVDGFEAQLERRKPITSIGGQDDGNQDSSKSDAKLKFRLASTVPNNWIPYIPVSNGNGGMHLRQGQMLRSIDAEKPTPIEPMTRILIPGQQGDSQAFLQEESVPRSGVKVLLTAQRVRGCDGSTHVWLGRKVVTGRGEGHSGLKFDHLTDVTS